MNYDYKILDADPSKMFVKRMMLYLAMLFAIVALALVILLILFERYLMLILPAGMIVISAVIWYLLGRKTSAYEYHFTEKGLTVDGGKRFSHTFSYETLRDYKNAEKSDFLRNGIIKIAFINSRIILKNAVNDNTGSIVFVLIDCNSSDYLLGFDEYAIALIGGAK